jgi:hypothetical protein
LETCYLSFDRNSRAEAPDPQHFHALRNRIINFSNVEHLLRMPQDLSPVSQRLPSPAEQTSSADHRHTDTVQDEYSLDDWTSSDPPPHRFPAAPWTTLTSDDEAVSHLVSLFLAWLNPGWRFVEADIFLGMAKLCIYSFH